MRLKGGKLLLDTTLHIGDDETIDLMQEQIKAILEKGLVVRIQNGDYTFTHDVVFNIIGNDFLRETLTDPGSGSTYGLVLSLLNKTLSLVQD